VRTADHREVIRLIAKGAQIADALPSHEYRSAHIAGAVHLPLERVLAEGRALLRTDRPIIVYCRDAL
jgi:phage shock protein E